MRRLFVGVVAAFFGVVACGDNGSVGPLSTSPGDSGGAGEPAVGGSSAGAPVVPLGGEGGLSAPLGGAPGSDFGGEAGGANGPVLLDVHGVVKLQGFRAPGVAVLVDDVSTITDSQGEFTVQGVAASYRAVVIAEDEQVITVFDELSVREPILNVETFVPRSDRTSSISGKLSGTATPLPAGHVGAISFHSEEIAGWGVAELAAGDDSYALGPIDWAGPEALLGELQALTWKAGGATPEAFVGFARKAFTVQDGQAHGAANGSVPAANLALTDPDDVVVPGNLVLPAGYDFEYEQLVVGANWVPLTLAAGEFSLVVPDLELPMALSIRFVTPEDVAGDAYMTVARPSAGGSWELSPVVAAELVLPVADAQGVTLDTAFSTGAAPERSVSVFGWFFSNWLVNVVTTEREVTLPDLTAQGVVYSGDVNYWSVRAVGPAETVDQYLEVSDADWRDAPVTRWLAHGEERAFVLAQ